MTTALIAAITWPVERSGGGFENARRDFFFSFLQLSHTLLDRSRRSLSPVALADRYRRFARRRDAFVWPYCNNNNNNDNDNSSF